MKTSRSHILAATAALALLLGCKPHATARSDVLAVDASPDAEVSFESIRKLILAESLQSVDELLPRLPETFRARFLLLRESESVQEGSVTAPRVLMYTPNAEFVMAFNGDPAQSSYFDLETLEFDAVKGAFTFREIEFPEPGDTDGVHFSGDNPAECKSCHRNPPRPIFNSWPSWPGAFFSVDQTAEGVERPTQGAADFETFKSAAAGHGRYQHLIGLEAYGDPDRAERGEPARTLNGLLLAQIDQMVLAEMQRHPRHLRYRHVFDAAIAGCADIPSFLPAAETRDFTRSYASIRQDVLAKNASASPTVIALRWLFENHGMRTVHWSPTNVPRYAFRRGPEPDGLHLPRSFPEMTCEQLKVASLAGG